MKDLQVTDKIKMEVVQYLECEYDESMTDELFKFYYYCMINGLHFADADRYAILNTLFNYDIGLDNAMKIDKWMYEHDEELYELNADNSKEILEKAVKELKLDINFDDFITENFTKYKYF